MEQIGGRRLPARARDADDRQRLRRSSPELVGDRCERGAGIRDEDLRRGEVEAPFHDERDGSVRDGVCRPVVPVHTEAADAEEDAAAAHAPGVDGQIVDNDPSVAADRARVERGEHVAQLHWRRLQLHSSPSGTSPRLKHATCSGVNGGRESSSRRWNAQNRCTM